MELFEQVFDSPVGGADRGVAGMTMDVAEPAVIGECAEFAGTAGTADRHDLAELNAMTARVAALAADLAEFMGLAASSDRPAAPDSAPSRTAAASHAAAASRAVAADVTMDAARVSQIGALEVLKSAASAVQACASAAFAVSQRSSQERAGVPPERAGRGIASQIGLARRESANKGGRLLGLSRCLVDEMPFTLRALARGELNEWRAMLIARETAVLSKADRAAVDRELCGPSGNLEGLGDGALARAARAIAQRLDPGAAWARAQKAVRQRRVTIRPAPDCMVTLTAHLPVLQGVAVYAALSQAADTAIATGQATTGADGADGVDGVDGSRLGRGQLMADELIARVLGPQHGAPEVPEPAVEIQLIMTDLTLLGLDDNPAHLNGYGPIPAPLARRIAAGEGNPDAVRWIRRLYKEPDGGLIAMDSHRRLYPDGLRRFMIARDQFCRTAWCDALIRQIDHVDRAEDGGPTSAGNGQGLCEACNHANQAPGWKQTSSGISGQVITTTPTGHRYVSTPPPPPGSPAPPARPNR